MAPTGRDIAEMPLDPAVGAMPSFELIEEWIHAETDGLTEPQLDFDQPAPAPEWMWWSIRRQVSHVAWVSLIFAKRRCAGLLWPDADVPAPITWEDHHQGRGMKFDRVLDEDKFWALGDILEKLAVGTNWLRRVVTEHSIDTLRSTVESRPATKFWAEAVTTLPRGAHHDDNDIIHYDLEGSLWMVFYENAAHVRTIQRLKEAQGLPSAVEIPRTGYLRLPHYWGDTDASGPAIEYVRPEFGAGAGSAIEYVRPKFGPGAGPAIEYVRPEFGPGAGPAGRGGNEAAGNLEPANSAQAARCATSTYGTT